MSKNKKESIISIYNFTLKAKISTMCSPHYNTKYCRRRNEKQEPSIVRVLACICLKFFIIRKVKNPVLLHVIK